MAYTKTVWVDEVLAGVERFNINDNIGTPIETNVAIELATSVVTAGTAVNAANLNNIETGIENLDLEATAQQETLTVDDAVEIGVVSGVLTVTQSSHKVQPESGTTDDIVTIAGMEVGGIYLFRASDAATDSLVFKHGTGNISCFGGSDIRLQHGIIFAHTDGTTVFISGGLNKSQFICQGRLTLQSGVPISITDQIDKTVLYFTPFNGNKISLYNGAVWEDISFAELSLNTSAYTASKPYDIWCYSNAGTATLESTVWTDATTRATDLTYQDGVYVKTGDATRRYIGTVYVDSAQKLQDTETKRLIFNYYNRLVRKFKKIETTDSWNYTTATWRSANNSTANRVEAMIGVAEVFANISVLAFASNGTAVDRHVGIGVDKTNANDCDVKAWSNALNIIPFISNIKYNTIGYHYFQWVEHSNAAGTCTWYGDGGEPQNRQAGIFGEILA